MNSKDNIRVHIRIKPSPQTSLIVKLPQNSITLADRPQGPWIFDSILSQTAAQAQVYQRVGRDAVQRCLQGYESCILAYGQTGSGKTYTMIGQESQKQRGIIPRALLDIFARISKRQLNISYLIQSSYYEIYNQLIFDLIRPGSNSLLLREDLKLGVFVQGLSWHQMNSLQEAMLIIQQGSKNRHVASTKCNRQSSRSHSIFVINIKTKKEVIDVEHIISRKFYFVDLAGSQRAKDTLASGERFKEGCSINKSLSVLGQCISALVESSEGKQRFIHYRDSKLTMLLRQCLGENSKTSFVANVSSMKQNINQTVSTLNFAKRAKQIRQQASIKQQFVGSTQALAQQIRKLRIQNQVLREKLGKEREQPQVSQSCSQDLRRLLLQSVRRESLLIKQVKQLQRFFKQTIVNLQELEQLQANLRMIICLYEAKFRRTQSNSNFSFQELFQQLPFKTTQIKDSICQNINFSLLNQLDQLYSKIGLLIHKDQFLFEQLLLQLQDQKSKKKTVQKQCQQLKLQMLKLQNQKTNRDETITDLNQMFYAQEAQIFENQQRYQELLINLQELKFSVLSMKNHLSSLKKGKDKQKNTVERNEFSVN